MAIPALKDSGDLAELAPEPRNPMLTEMPGADDTQQFSDEDLMTPEELAAAGAGALQPAKPPKFNDNLAEDMEDNYLTTLGEELIEIIEADLQSRQDWEMRFKRGLQIIGLVDFQGKESLAAFEGGSTTVHPMLAEAGFQSMARAVEELLPATGPAKTQVMGQEDDLKREAADRVANHMNYQLTIEDEVYFFETNQLHLYNTWFGSVFRKAHHDYLTDRNVLRMVKGVDLIMPYDATSPLTSPRLTHRFPLNENDMKKMMKLGGYRHVDNLAEPDDPEPTESAEAVDDVDGTAPVRHDKDMIYTIYEIDIAYDLKGYEDPDGIGLPYTISVDKDSGKVLAIRRCWKEKDPLRNRRTRYAPYAYLPGLGPYGYGLLHTIGSLGEGASGALQALLDSATWANMQGGFVAKDANPKAGSISRKPNQWLQLDMTAEELKSAFYTPPVTNPSQALFNLLGMLTDLGRRFAGTVDLMVGDGNNNAPVGTTVAMIEQGQKIYSSIHKRGHASVGIELRMLYELNAEYIPAEGYPYKVPGDDMAVFQKDYDESIVSVVPVSDPNIFSQTQRIAQAQAVYEMYLKEPQKFVGHEVKKRVLLALKVPDIDALLIDDTKPPPPMDPVSENMAMATMRPVKAHEGEPHQAHLAVHMAFMQHPQFGGNPEAQKLIMPAMMAHMAEHVALLYGDIMRHLGVQVPQTDMSAPPGQPMSQQPFDPNVAAQIAQQAAAMSQAFMQQSGLSAPPQDQRAQESEIRKTDAQAFAAFGTGAAGLAKAATTIMQGMSELGALPGELGDGPPAPGGALQPPQQSMGQAIGRQGALQ